MNLIDELRRLYPPKRLLAGAAELAPYESDALTAFRARPRVVVLPETPQEVVATVRLCHEAKVPFVARGSGTSLSGGSLPIEDGVVIGLNRLRRILRLDPRERIAVVGVVTQPDKPQGRSRSTLVPPPVKVVANEEELLVLQPEKPRGDAFVGAVRELAPDLSVVVAYGHILPRDVIDLPPLGTLNIHASLLPRWRGAAPIQSAILAGDTETGVSIMRMVPALDAGPVILQAATEEVRRQADVRQQPDHDVARPGLLQRLHAIDQTPRGGLGAGGVDHAELQEVVATAGQVVQRVGIGTPAGGGQIAAGAADGPGILDVVDEAGDEAALDVVEAEVLRAGGRRNGEHQCGGELDHS